MGARPGAVTGPVRARTVEKRYRDAGADGVAMRIAPMCCEPTTPTT